MRHRVIVFLVSEQLGNLLVLGVSTASTCPDKFVLLYIYKGISSLLQALCIVFHTVVINKKKIPVFSAEEQILR